jgi:FkbM family methyltransferase
MNQNHPEVSIPTSTLEYHCLYTRTEFENSKYYMSVLEFLKERKIENMIDIGGCAGETSIILLENIPTLKKCIILEPIQENFMYISNRIDNLTTIVINKAVYYGSDSIKLERDKNSVGAWSISFINDNSLNFETITIEEISDLIDSSIDFVKIDIEGAEVNLIENSNIIHEIKYIEIEFHRDLILSSKWIPYVEKWLPNHTIVFGGQDGRNQDGSAFLIRKDLF